MIIKCVNFASVLLRDEWQYFFELQTLGSSNNGLAHFIGLKAEQK